MRVDEYEKAVLSVILRYPGSEQNNVGKRICMELDAAKFDPLGANGIVYGAIQRVVLDHGVPNVPNVARALAGNLERVGGEEYLQSLLGFLPIMGVHGSDGFETWVRVVDNAGRLRQLGLVIDKYAKVYSDFQQLVAKTEDVDTFIANVLTEINKGIGGITSSYSHISVATDEDLWHLDQERRGLIVDLVPCGWPSLERYHIPRPGSYGVIVGITSMGKSQFAFQIALGVAIKLKENGLPGCVGINELEMLKWRVHRRLTCCLLGANSQELADGVASPELYMKYFETAQYVRTLPIYMDDNPNLNSQKMVWNAAAMHLEHGPRKLGIADYLELFADESDSEELRVSNVVRTHRKMCWELGSCEIAISQFNNSVLQTNSKIGGLGRTRYSGAIGHAADWFIEIYNPIQMRKSGWVFSLPDGYNEGHAYALIEKNKDYPVGKEPFEWTPEFTRFRDMSLPMNELYRPSGYVEQEDF